MAVDGQRFMTKTQHYRKITKPLLERKRRARMNLYLDELKELIVDSMEADGEHIAKLEKADILELTVNYLKSQRPKIKFNANATAAAAGGGRLPLHNAEKYCAGYTQAAYEVSKVFATLPGVDLKFGTHLLKHLGCQLREFKHTNGTPKTPQSPPSPPPVQSSTTTTAMRRTTAAAANAAPHAKQQAHVKVEDVWRPW